MIFTENDLRCILRIRLQIEGVESFAESIGVTPIHLIAMARGSVKVSKRVAAALGFRREHHFERVPRR